MTALAQQSIQKTGVLILLGILFCLRYLGFDSAPFNGDEASLQIAARNVLQAGEVPWLGLAGTAGAHYGPTGIWFYAFLRAISPQIEFAFFVHATLHGLGFLLQGIAFQRVLKLNLLVPFLVFAWSAPLFWISARNIWDNSLQVFLFGVLAVLLAPAENKESGIPAWRAMLAGLFTGLLVNLHLMAVPITAAWIAWAWKRGNLRKRDLLLMGAVVLTLIAPYLWAAFSAPRPVTSEPKAWFHFFHRALVFPFLLPGLVLPGRVAYFFDQPWESWAGVAARLWSDFGLSGILQLMGVALGALGLKRLSAVGRRFVLMHLIFYGLFVAILRLNIQIHPHYLNPVFGFAVLLWTLGWVEMFKFKRRLAIFFIVGICILNLSAILKIETTVRKHGGFRGPHWGASLGELKRVAAEYCDRKDLRETFSPRLLALDPRLGFDPSKALEYLRSERAGCASGGDRVALPLAPRWPESTFSAALALPAEPKSN